MLPRWRRLSPPPEIGNLVEPPWRLLLRLDASYLSAVGSDHLFIDHFIRREPRMLVGSPGDAVRREHAQADALDTGAAKALAQRIEKRGRDATAPRKHADVRDETESV